MISSIHLPSHNIVAIPDLRTSFHYNIIHTTGQGQNTATTPLGTFLANCCLIIIQNIAEYCRIFQNIVLTLELLRKHSEIKVSCTAFAITNLPILSFFLSCNCIVKTNKILQINFDFAQQYATIEKLGKKCFGAPHY